MKGHVHFGHIKMYAVLCWIVILCCWQETQGIVDHYLCVIAVCVSFHCRYCIAGFLTHTLSRRIRKLWTYHESTDGSITPWYFLCPSSQIWNLYVEQNQSGTSRRTSWL